MIAHSQTTTLARGVRAQIALTLFAFGWLSGCASPSSTSAPSAATEPPPPGACAPLDLRTPAGDTVQLTGRWRSPDHGIYYLRQSGSCVWFTGLSGDPDAPGIPAGGDWTNSFFGTLASNFMIHGSWADLPLGNDAGVGVISWRIDFANVDLREGVTLEVTDVTGGFGARFLVKPEQRTDFRVRLQGTEGCIAASSDDGEAYELILAPGWGITNTGLSGPNREVVRVLDAFEVTGDLARGTGDCGPGLIIFADRIQLSTAPLSL